MLGWNYTRSIVILMISPLTLIIEVLTLMVTHSWQYHFLAPSDSSFLVIHRFRLVNFWE